MTGSKESLLTKVHCIMMPGRFLPILTYSMELTRFRVNSISVVGVTVLLRFVSSSVGIASKRRERK